MMSRGGKQTLPLCEAESHIKAKGEVADQLPRNKRVLRQALRIPLALWRWLHRCIQITEFVKLYNLTSVVFCMPIELFKKEDFPPKFAAYLSGSPGQGRFL